MKIRQLEPSCPMWTDRSRDRPDDDNSRFSKFSERAYKMMRKKYPEKHEGKNFVLNTLSLNLWILIITHIYSVMS